MMRIDFIKKPNRVLEYEKCLLRFLKLSIISLWWPGLSVSLDDCILDNGEHWLGPLISLLSDWV